MKYDQENYVIRRALLTITAKFNQHTFFNLLFYSKASLLNTLLAKQIAKYRLCIVLLIIYCLLCNVSIDIIDIILIIKIY